MAVAKAVVKATVAQLKEVDKYIMIGKWFLSPKQKIRDSIIQTCMVYTHTCNTVYLVVLLQVSTPPQGGQAAVRLALPCSVRLPRDTQTHPHLRFKFKLLN